MRTVSISWDKEGGRFTALGTHTEPARLRSTLRNGNRKLRGPTGFSATELLLAGAGACACWDVVEILRKRRASVESLDVAVEGTQQDEPPWSYTRVALHFRVVCDSAHVLGHGARHPAEHRPLLLRHLDDRGSGRHRGHSRGRVRLDGTSTGRKPIELAIPSSPGVESGFTESDLAAVGLPEPVADEDE